MSEAEPSPDAIAVFSGASSAIENLQGEVERLARARARAVAELHLRGASHRDVAELLQMSHSRVSQLIKGVDSNTLSVLNAWIELQSKLATVAPLVGVPSGAARRNPRNVIDALQLEGLLDMKDARALQDIREKRLAVIEGRIDLADDEASDFVGDAARLSGVLSLLREDDVVEADEAMNQYSCFVIGPIGDRLAPRGSVDRVRYEQALRVWEEVILPACREVGLEPLRADSITRAGEITDQIFRALRDADVVIADVTGGNPNVMYELGLRHTTGKLTVQIGEASKLPFDVQAVSTVLFNRSELGYVDAREALVQALSTGLDEGFDPVSATRVWREGEALHRVAEEQDEPEDEPGFLEILAEAEAAMPLAGEALERIAEIQHDITALVNEATREVEAANARGGSAGARLAITRKLAQKLLDPATRLQAEADSYAELMMRTDPGMSYLLEQLDENPQAMAEAGDFPDAIEQLADVTKESLQAAAELIDSLGEAGKSSRDLARTNGLIRGAMQQLIDESAPIERWGNRIRQIKGTSF